MKTEEIKDYLVRNAVREHGCADGVAQLAMAGNNEDMLQVFIDRIDFCLAKNSPGKDELKRFFLAEDLREKGFYIDEAAVVEHDRLEAKRVVVLGHSDILYKASGYSVSRLYVKHDAQVRIVVSGHARVMVDVLDGARVYVESERPERVNVHLFGDGECYGNASVVKMNRETYEL